MKRIIGYILIVAMLISVFSCTMISSTASNDVQEELLVFLRFDKEAALPGDTVKVSLCVENNNFNGEWYILGMNFAIGCDYFGPYIPSVSAFDLDEGSIEYAEEIPNGDHLVISNGEIKFLYDGVANTVINRKTITLVTFTLNVNEKAYGGEYQFRLRCDDFYYQSQAGSLDFPDLNYMLESAYYEFFIGEDRTIPLSLGGDDYNVGPFYFDGVVKPEECVISSQFGNQILVFDDRVFENGIQVDKDNEYSLLYFKGIGLGTAIVYISQGQRYSDNFLIHAIRVKVEPAQILFVSLSQMPKTEYYIGEKFDLTGAMLRVDYYSYETIFTDEFYSVTEPDLSTTGEKEVIITYRDNYFQKATAKFKITVKEVPITSSLYAIEPKIISNISAKTSIEDLSANIVGGNSFKFTLNGEPITDGYIKTGMQLSVLGVSPEYTTTLVVNDDLNGNGRVDVGDLAMLKKAKAGVRKLDELQLKALKIESENSINAQDLIAMQKQILGINQ